MKNRIDLTEGRITEKLIKLALPIMGTSFIQMAYNLVDMIWVGRVGSSAVAAVGTAGFYPWLAMAFVMISKVGGEVKVSQSVGKNDYEGAKSYIKAAIEINIILSIIYSAILLIFAKQLVGLFKLGDTEVIKMAKDYIRILAIGMPCYFINPVFTSIFNGLGNSRTPFKINTIGLVVNIVLDPILILGLLGVPNLGVHGAAIATVFSQILVTVCFMVYIIKNKIGYFNIILFKNINTNIYKLMYKLGIPVAIQSGMFTIFSMAIGVVVAAFGPVAVAVQKVGSQIESISWMSADGLAVAISTFIGQNYGAKKYDRINRGMNITLGFGIALGTLTTIILVFFGEDIFKIFINEPEATKQGAMYLKILGYSQLFMCLEILTAGVFKGLGRTYIPSIIITIFTGARVPIAYLLSTPNMLGLNGVWWSITLSSIVKGILLFSILTVLLKKGKLYLKDTKNIIIEE